MRITVVGTGYVGLVAGTCFAETGNDVTCLDIDASKVERLNRGELTIYEPGLQDLFKRNTREGRLKFTTSYVDAVAHAKVFFLCLPTPPMEDGSADLRYCLAAVQEIAKHIKAGPAQEQALFVLKSTVPVGTHDRIKAAVSAIFPGPFSVASNPEFLKEGAAVEDFMKPDRIVVGVTNDDSYSTMKELYEPFCRTGAPILRMDPASAELTKYAANCFLAIKISFMNETARLCEAFGADIEHVRKGISSDARIGKAFLFPGLGYGGSCFPKDTRAMSASARSCGLSMSLVDAAEQVNDTQKTILFPKIEKHFNGNLKGKTIALWGLAFKPKTDDIREAPALVLAEKLIAAGVRVQAYDPEAMENVKRTTGGKIMLASSPYDALKGADGLVLVTEWNEFRSPDWDKVKSLLKTPVVFDGRNIFEPVKLRELGFSYYGIGRK